MPDCCSTCRTLPKVAPMASDFSAPSLQFMIGETMPRLADQIAFYKQVIDARQATSLSCFPHARSRRRQGAALCAGSSARKIRRSGGARIRIALDRAGSAALSGGAALLVAAAGRTLRIPAPLISDVCRV